MNNKLKKKNPHVNAINWNGKQKITLWSEASLFRYYNCGAFACYAIEVIHEHRTSNVLNLDKNTFEYLFWWRQVCVTPFRRHTNAFHTETLALTHTHTTNDWTLYLIHSAFVCECYLFVLLKFICEHFLFWCVWWLSASENAICAKMKISNIFRWTSEESNECHCLLLVDN